MSLLEVRDLGIQFGGLKAVDGVTLDVQQGEIVGLIGPNGAGKTTVFNLLTKVYMPTQGSMRLENIDITRLSTHTASISGLSRTFQNIRLFSSMTVLENIKVACHNQMKYTGLEAALRLPRFWKEEAAADKMAHALLKIFDMDHLSNDMATSLPYGQQRKLEICRALASNPRILLLDEPAAGMNPSETKDLMDTIYKIRDNMSLSILLIEHDMNFVMGICERIYVLNQGRIIAEGPPVAIQNNAKVIKAYLGSGEI